MAGIHQMMGVTEYQVYRMDVKCIAKTSCLSTRFCYFQFKTQKDVVLKGPTKTSNIQYITINISLYIYIYTLCILYDIKFETSQFPTFKNKSRKAGCRTGSRGSHRHNQSCSASPRWNIKHQPRNGIHAPWLWPPRSIAIKALSPKSSTKTFLGSCLGLRFLGYKTHVLKRKHQDLLKGKKEHNCSNFEIKTCCIMLLLRQLPLFSVTSEDKNWIKDYKFNMHITRCISRIKLSYPSRNMKFGFDTVAKSRVSQAQIFIVSWSHP